MGLQKPKLVQMFIYLSRVYYIGLGQLTTLDSDKNDVPNEVDA